ncbi:MAG: hypothetical protein WAV20_06115 [Blastocatellia bacterium]
MAVEVCQQAVTELFELNEQPVSISVISYDADHAALGMPELQSLIQDVEVIHDCASKKEVLLITIGGELFEALVQEQRADYVLIGCRRANSIRCAFAGRDKFCCDPKCRWSPADDP